MKITKQEVDALNAVLTLEIQQEDYTPQVDKILKITEKTPTFQDLEKDRCQWA